MLVTGYKFRVAGYLRLLATHYSLPATMLELSEQINVWVFFKGIHIYPYVFFWRKRKIKVETVNLVHTSREEGATVYHFSISSGGNFYRLKFSLKDLKWFIEALEES